MDLTVGDTAGYFSRAAGWKEMRVLERPSYMVYSPLYAVYYGELLRAFSDPFAATIVHRILIMAAAAVCILGVARNLLSGGLAWLVAAWWVALPVNWAGLYEVHFFSFALLALGCWLAGAGTEVWWRALSLGALLCSAAFVRNEFVLSYLLLGGCFVAYETICTFRKQQSMRDCFLNVLRLFFPSAVVMVAAIVLFSGNPRAIEWRHVKEAFERRQRANMVQVYAFSYQQRHPEWTKNAFLDGGELMQRDFGSANAKWSEAFRANRKAFMEHVQWNLSLVPAGLELGLFNAYHGANTPDYFTHESQGIWPLLALLAVAALSIAALILGWKTRSHGELRWRHGLWTAVALACCLLPCLVAIVTQRPRPSYILPMLLAVMVITGASLMILGRLISKVSRAAGFTVAYAPILALVLVLVIRPETFASRRLLTDYRRIEPYAQLIRNKKRVFCTNSVYSGELVLYLGGRAEKCPQPLDFSTVRDWMTNRKTFREALEHFHVTDLFLEGMAVRSPDFVEWQSQCLQDGWRQVAVCSQEGMRWAFYTRGIPSDGDAKGGEKAVATEP